MKKSGVLLVAILCLLFVSNILVADDQYEYMVVSLGKNFFTEINAKTYAYFDEIPTASHAFITEYQLDILGRHSWEVIDMLGAIGGDQQITLKRIYDEERTKKELKAIEENQTKAQSKKAKAPVLEVPKREKPTLIDLDAKEAAEKEVQRKLQNEQDKLQNEQEMMNLVRRVLVGKLFRDINVSWKKGYGTSENTLFPSIEVNYDVTSEYLLGKNTYRHSQINSYLEKEINKLVAITKDLNNLRERPDWIHLHAYITYENERFFVGSKSLSYSIYSKTWDMY